MSKLEWPMFYYFNWLRHFKQCLLPIILLKKKKKKIKPRGNRYLMQRGYSLAFSNYYITYILGQELTRNDIASKYPTIIITINCKVS